MIYLKHPTHGEKFAALEAEAANDEKNGWFRAEFVTHPKKGDDYSWLDGTLAPDSKKGTMAPDGKSPALSVKAESAPAKAQKGRASKG